jgi:hypothetical protein
VSGNKTDKLFDQTNSPLHLLLTVFFHGAFSIPG